MTAMKGVRKSARNRPAGIRIGNRVLAPQFVIAGLLSLLYVFFLLGGSYEGRDITVQLIYFALFGVMIFMLGAGQKYYAKLAYAFLALAIPPMLWQVADCLGYVPAVPDQSWLLQAGVVSLVLGAGLVAALLYSDRGKPADVYLGAGDVKGALQAGTIALAAAAVLAAAYIVFHSGADASQIVPATGSLAIFAVACAIGEEMLFRGLLLSRLLPMIEAKAAFSVQAVAFAAYEAAFMHMLNPDPLYSAVLFVVAGIAGMALAWMTVKNKSLLAAIMAHAGLYLIIATPVFAIFF